MAALLLCATCASAQLSVTVSDNVVVLDGKNQSGSIDLVNLGSDPVDFSVNPLRDPNSDTSMDEALIRWAPSRVLVQPNRSARLRVMARPNISTNKSEHLVRLGITATVQRPPQGPNGAENAIEGVAVTVPLIPTLPIFVYVRSAEKQAPVKVDAFILTPEHEKFSGYFPVYKSDIDQSFVGQVKIVNKANNEVVSEGRIHLPQGTQQSLVQIVRNEKSGDRPGIYCVYMWDRFPGLGNPMQTVCP